MKTKSGSSRLLELPYIADLVPRITMGLNYEYH